MMRVGFSSDTIIPNRQSSMKLKHVNPISTINLDKEKQNIPTSSKTPADHSTVHFVNTGNTPPIAQRCRRLFGTKYQQAKTYFEELLQSGIVRTSKSPWASPLVLVKKKDGTFRPCGDYRLLNQATVSDKYPLPRIEDILYKAGHGKIFTKIDLQKAYNQIPMNKDDIQKTAIIAPFGLFEYLFMPFGLKCSAQTFQRHIDSILRPMDHCTQAYIDDILIYSNNNVEHEENVREVLRILESAQLKINHAKCEYSKTSVDFLGFNISHKGIQPISQKVKAIQELECPTSLKSLRHFLGAMAFYHRCMPSISTILSPLYDLQAELTKLNNGRKWKWNEKHTAAFINAKKLLKNATALAIPESGKTFTLTCDASDVGIGSVLQQFKKPVAFYSRTLNAAEKKV